MWWQCVVIQSTLLCLVYCTVCLLCLLPEGYSQLPAGLPSAEYRRTQRASILPGGSYSCGPVCRRAVQELPLVPRFGKRLHPMTRCTTRRLPAAITKIGYSHLDFASECEQSVRRDLSP